MKVLFLDIDGVLNSSDWFIATYETRKSAKKNYEKIMIADYRNARWEFDISRELANNLKRIMDEVKDLNIVVSSTWRLHYSIDELKKRLSKLLAISPDRIVGKTPRLFEARGKEIKQWLSENIVEKFAIVDDDSDMEDLMEHLIQTKNKNGLQQEHADKIIEYFNA